MPREASGLEGEYDALPEPIKAIYSFKEYAWMGAARRATLLQVETEPEHEEP